MSRAVLLLAAALLLAGLAASRPVERSDRAFLRADRDPDSVDYTAEAELDRVKHLPGAPPAHHVNLFSGYITVDEDAGRALFYTFVESTNKPSSDPLVLWLNGGPGCSSLGGGLLSELGPFYPTPGGEELVPNGFAWNNVANMLFIESPAFVGFSYSNTSDDAVTGDKRTAADSREFLLRWFDRFPDFRSHPFWLSGESYAGHYVPQLAAAILKGNRKDPDEEAINLQGFLVGNAWTDAATDNQAAVDFWYTHAITSRIASDGIDENCDSNTVGPLSAAASAAAASEAEADVFVSAVEQPAAVSAAAMAALGGKAARCDRFVNQAMEEMGGINIYDIYADVCLPTPAKQARQLALMLQGHPAGASTRHLIQGKYDPCIDSETEAYLNRRDVQEALHANISGSLPGPWQDCTQRVQYSRRDLLSSMLPVYRKLVADGGIKILVYSGDVDAIVPVIGTRRWIHSLDLPVTTAWRPWRSATQQVGGWTVDHEGLTFASVRGAGHMVPYTQQERALHLFTKWVHQQPL